MKSAGALNLAETLYALRKRGCYPSLYWRGSVWRAHVNASGNYWGEDKNPLVALHRAMRAWELNGCPMDGMADEAKKA